MQPMSSHSWYDQESRWECGRWQARLRGDEIAELACDGVTVLRSVRAVVRDRDWNTAPLSVDSLSEQPSGFTLHVHTRELGTGLAGTVQLEVTGDTVVVTLAVRASAAFDTNRTGLVVLHPPELGSRPLRVKHTDGTTEQTFFPDRISPHQPALDIAALSWHTDSHDVTVSFDGDVFEMEDQRNWTDASFKTYSRPLSLPFPYLIAAGELIRQSISVHARNSGAAAAPASTVTHLALKRSSASFPSLSTMLSSAPEPAPEGSAPPSSELLVELDLATPNWRAVADRAGTRHVPLDVRFVLDPDREVRPQLVEALSALGELPIARCGAFHRVGPARHVSDAEAVAGLRAAQTGLGRTAPIVAGSRAHFTELNREFHRIPADANGITTSSTPLFHSTGTAQLLESVGMQRLIALETVQRAAGRTAHIGPITLLPRFNDVTTEPQPGPTVDDLSAGYGAHVFGAADHRQHAPELAAWLVASAAAFAVPGVSTLTYFEEWGPQGLRDADGVASPAAHAFADLVALDGDLLWAPHPHRLLWALGAVSDAGATVLVANLGERSAEVVLTIPVLRSDYRVTVPAFSFSRHFFTPQEL